MRWGEHEVGVSMRWGEHEVRVREVSMRWG